MSVILKQRTWETADGRAVADGHLEARILVGPAGAKVTDERAESLGLQNGEISKPGRAVPEKEVTGTRKLLADAQDDRSEKIKAAMHEMANDVDTMTKAGKPDAQILSARLEFTVKAKERDEVWAVVEEELTAP